MREQNRMMVKADLEKILEEKALDLKKLEEGREEVMRGLLRANSGENFRIVVEKILDLVDVDLEEAESRIVNLVQEVIEELENSKLSFEDADRIFTALLALKNVELSENTEELLTVANELHEGNGRKIATLKILIR